MIADLEEEKRRRAQEAAHSDDFTFMLRTERDKLLQQVWLTCNRSRSVLWASAGLVLTDLARWWMSTSAGKDFFCLPFPSPLPGCTVWFIVAAVRWKVRSLCNSVGWRGPALLQCRHTQAAVRKRTGLFHRKHRRKRPLFSCAAAVGLYGPRKPEIMDVHVWRKVSSRTQRCAHTISCCTSFARGPYVRQGFLSVSHSSSSFPARVVFCPRIMHPIVFHHLPFPSITHQSF